MTHHEITGYVLAAVIAITGCYDSEPSPERQAAVPEQGTPGSEATPTDQTTTDAAVEQAQSPATAQSDAGQPEMPQIVVPDPPTETPADAGVVDSFPVRSTVLGVVMRVEVYLPPGYSLGAQYPLLYVLHGYSHYETNWYDKIQIHLIADALIEAGRIRPLIMMAPRMENSWGINSAEVRQLIGGEDIGTNAALGPYEDWLMAEMMPLVESRYSLTVARTDRFIGGESMGGYAAMRLGFKYAERFSKIGGHMPAFSLVGRNPFPLPSDEPMDLARTADLAGMSVYLDAGNLDGQWPDIQAMAAVLQERGVPVETHLNEGNHSSAYVKSQFENYLLFYAGV